MERSPGPNAPSGVVRAIESDLLLHWRMLGESDVIYYDEQPELILYGPKERPSAFFDGVLMARFSDNDADERIDEILEGFGYPAQPVIWSVTPSSTPPDLGDRLLRRGLMLRARVPGMAHDLGSLPPATAPAELEIAPVRDASRLAELNDVASPGFGHNAGLADVFHRAYRALSFTDPGWVPYVGFLDGVVVGSAILMHNEGIAGLHAMAVRAEYRRRGIGSALALRILQAGRDRDCSLVVLRSSELGEPMYTSVGFREHCRISQYWWLPPGLER